MCEGGRNDAGPLRVGMVVWSWEGAVVTMLLLLVLLLVVVGLGRDCAVTFGGLVEVFHSVEGFVLVFLMVFRCYTTARLSVAS